ncbi:hypothetical protein Q6285_29505, partial [Klebsiella pneumoniae]|nr:hypothetical protein [Klebsiella pneumoniae]
MADKYSSLENHYREKSIEIARFNGYMSNYLPWVAREKLHGANFSFAGHLNEHQGISWDFHTRRTQITLEDSFHGFQSVYERIVDNLNRA